MTTKTFESLYHKGKSGEIRIWTIWTEDNVIKTEYGVLNGEMVTSEKKAFGKNIGKANETTDIEQAQAEAQSMWTFKLERKYSKTIAEATLPSLLPMLAKEAFVTKVNKKGEVTETTTAVFPCYAQPKLDGVRCIAYWDKDRVILLSRGGKEWTVPKHIKEQVEKVLPKESIFDGELYIHGAGFQKIAAYVKKWRDVETPTVEYHIYDMPVVDGVEDLPFDERLSHLTLTLFSAPCPVPNLILVDTWRVNSKQEAKDFESEAVKRGYEGGILRNSKGLYLFAYRSSDLLKVKTFQDAEFKVLSIREGVGKFEGCAVFNCKNDLNDLEFECTMAATMEERAEFFKHKEKYIGRKLTVKFFERTDDKLPRFPVGKAFRDKKDLDVSSS